MAWNELHMKESTKVDRQAAQGTKNEALFDLHCSPYPRNRTTGTNGAAARWMAKHAEREDFQVSGQPLLFPRLHFNFLLD